MRLSGAAEVLIWRSPCASALFRFMNLKDKHIFFDQAMITAKIMPFIPRISISIYLVYSSIFLREYLANYSQLFQDIPGISILDVP